MTFGPYNVDYEQRAYNPERMRKERLARAHAALNKHGLGAMIVFDYDNFRYLGYYSRHNYARRRLGGFLLLVKDQGYPYSPRTEAVSSHEGELMPWCADKMVLKTSRSGMMMRGLNPDFITGHWDKVAKEIKGLLDDHGVANLPCGVDVSSHAIMQACVKAGIKLVDGNHVMEEARQIKTQDEIECLRMAGAITEGAMWEVAKALRPGVTEWYMAGVAAKALYKNGAEEMEGPSFVVCSGERSGHNVPAMPTDRIIRPGDMFIIDINGVSFQGYRTCFYRTFCVGDKPTPFQKQIYHNCYEYMMAMTNAIKPGRTSAEITEIVLNQGEGMWKGQPLWSDWPKPGMYHSPGGHQIGLCSGDPGAPFHNIRSRSDPPFTLQKNMCFAVEVGVYTWDGTNWAKDGVKLEHCGVVTDTGFEVFYRFPMKDLIVCGLPGVY
ncbi:MAG: aminopeptidase P family protein [Chloroflexi bacterium]|nr:aminopeptidase P family protein [Chloroflexota bacterium]